MPHVIYEGIYEPLEAPGSVPPARVEEQARPHHEASLQAYFDAHPEVSCEQTFDAQCSPGPLLVRLPDYVPAEEEPVAETRGCAALMNVNDAEPVAAGGADSAVLPERLYFAEGSTTLDPSSRPALEAIAAQLLAEPEIECLAVVGQGTFGESPGIAELRASAVRRLLIDRGVVASRLHPVALTTSTQGAGRPAEQPATDRRVQFRVLLRR